LVFDTFAKNRRGGLCMGPEEWKDACRRMLIHASQAEEVFKLFDPAGTGRVSRERFLAVCQEGCLRDDEDAGVRDRMVRLFADHVPSIGAVCADWCVCMVPSELSSMLRKAGISDHDARAMFRMVDEDQDGVVTFGEFFAAFKTAALGAAAMVPVEPFAAEAAEPVRRASVMRVPIRPPQQRPEKPAPDEVVQAEEAREKEFIEETSQFAPPKAKRAGKLCTKARLGRPSVTLSAPLDREQAIRDEIEADGVVRVGAPAGHWQPEWERPMAVEMPNLQQIVDDEARQALQRFVEVGRTIRKKLEKVLQETVWETYSETQKGLMRLQAIRSSFGGDAAVQRCRHALKDYPSDVSLPQGLFLAMLSRLRVAEEAAKAVFRMLGGVGEVTVATFLAALAKAVVHLEPRVAVRSLEQEWHLRGELTAKELKEVFQERGVAANAVQALWRQVTGGMAAKIDAEQFWELLVDAAIRDHWKEDMDLIDRPGGPTSAQLEVWRWLGCGDDSEWTISSFVAAVELWASKMVVKGDIFVSSMMGVESDAEPPMAPVATDTLKVAKPQPPASPPSSRGNPPTPPKPDNARVRPFVPPARVLTHAESGAARESVWAIRDSHAGKRPEKPQKLPELVRGGTKDGTPSWGERERREAVAVVQKRLASMGTPRRRGVDSVTDTRRWGGPGGGKLSMAQLLS